MGPSRPRTARTTAAVQVSPAPWGQPRLHAVRPTAGWGAQLVTTLLGAWMMVGLMVDGWAHLNRPQLETFFTPWHALFYSGFVATAGWMGWMARRLLVSEHGGWAAIPRGYELGVVGVLVFAAGGLGDLGWHTAFGIEQDLDALLSPTHLVLLVGLTLILTSPVRAAWVTPDPPTGSPSLRALLPAVLAVGLVTALLSFFVMYLSVFDSADALRERPAGVLRLSRMTPALRDLSIRAGLGSILVTNVLLLGPVLVMVRRWRLPLGSVTIVFTVPAILLTSLHEFWLWPLIPVTLASGLLTDGLIQLLRPTPEREVAYRLIAAAAPLVLWSGYMLTVQAVWGTWWSVELTTGVVVLASLSGLVLSVLVVPPTLPAATEQ